MVITFADVVYTQELILSETQNVILFFLTKTDDKFKRQELCDNLNIAWTTLYDNLAQLLQLGLVVKFSVKGIGRGRPSTFWKAFSTVSDEKNKELTYEKFLKIIPKFYEEVINTK